ncbi:MAG: hypothetical protein K2K19_08950 [Acetatifactor sp.]|nr:hypothetical protein [Acetatifactor sp.]
MYHKSLKNGFYSVLLEDVIMNTTKNKDIIILIGLCMILLAGCGSMVDTQQSEGLGIEADLQQNEELSEWEKLYDQWQGKELETKLSFGKEIYSVSVVRRCGNEDEDIFMTYNFSLDDTGREDVLKILAKEEHIITNNVLKAQMRDSVTFCIADDSGCIKEIGFPAAADETGPVYFTVSYLFPYKDRGDVRVSFAGELAYEDWKELMEIVNKRMAEKPFDEINILQ